MNKEIKKMSTIYEKHARIMYAVTMKILKNPHDAEDTVHNEIPLIMRNLEAIEDVDNKACVYYVIMVVKHISLNMIRDKHIQIMLIQQLRKHIVCSMNTSAISQIKKS